jgi:hypothetical protein
VVAIGYDATEAFDTAAVLRLHHATDMAKLSRRGGADAWPEVGGADASSTSSPTT